MFHGSRFEVIAVQANAEAREDADAHPEVVVKCPATGEVVGAVPIATAAEVEAVAARLREAQPAWQRLGVAQRASWMGKWRDWLTDHSDELLNLVQLEGGRSWGDTAGEMLLGLQVTNYWIDNAVDFLADESVRPFGAMNAAKKLTIVYEPYPLVGVITPWNAPVATPLADISAALLAGCAVLSKPSEFAPLAWQAAADGWKEIGAPEVLEVVHGFGETGSALVDVVDYVMFTGSVNTGRRIASAAGQRLIPYSLELGGKDAMIVCADADIDRAVDGAVWGGFMLSGQACVSVERVYVEAPVYDEFRAQAGGQDIAAASGDGHRPPLFLRRRIDGDRAATGHRVPACRRRSGQGREGAHRRQGEGQWRSGTLLRADGAGRRRPRDGLHA
jgi:acyl-CoA reductase-like NAD-dependent aldehyde dehydrogenase